MTVSVDRGGLWTVPHLPGDVDSGWTASALRAAPLRGDACPPAAHNALGQPTALRASSGLPTAAWTTHALRALRGCPHCPQALRSRGRLNQELARLRRAGSSVTMRAFEA